MLGYIRPDGQIGIRNRILVIYTVVCAEEISRKIISKVKDTSLIGWRSCHTNSSAINKLIRLACHPNIGGVLVVSHGCECTDAEQIVSEVKKSGKPVELMTIQEVGGTINSIRSGIGIIERLKVNSNVPTVPIRMEDLIVGVECGGSDTTSGLAANPAVGWTVDQVVAHGGRVIFEEAGEMWGCEQDVAERAVNPKVKEKIILALDRTKEWAESNGVEMFSTGNLAGGLTNIFEKSMGAIIKTGSSPIIDVLDSVTGDRPQSTPGTYLLDAAYYRGVTASGTTDVTDPIGVTEMVAAGAHLVLFTTGRGSVTGSGIAPVIKICGNPNTFERMKDNMDFNAGEIILGNKTIPQLGHEIFNEIRLVAGGKLTKNELLEHFEFHI